MTPNLKELVDDDPVLAWLDSSGRIGGYVSPGGWVDIICPWQDEHSDPEEIFAGYRPVMPEFHPTRRAFNCFHNSCRERTISEFLGFVAESGGPVADEIGCSALAAKLRRLYQDSDDAFTQGFLGPRRGGKR